MTFEEWFEKAYEPTYPIEGWEIEDLREVWDAAMEQAMTNIIAMYSRHLKETGYVLVPVEPTTAMEEAFLDIYERRGWFMRGYKNMIQAAQEEE